MAISRAGRLHPSNCSVNVFDKKCPEMGLGGRAEFRQQVMALGELDREPPQRGKRLRDEPG